MVFQAFSKRRMFFTETLGICVGFGSLHFDFFMWIANIVISLYLVAFVCERCTFEALNRFGLIVSSGAIISAT